MSIPIAHTHGLGATYQGQEGLNHATLAYGMLYEHIRQSACCLAECMLSGTRVTAGLDANAWEYMVGAMWSGSVGHAASLSIPQSLTHCLGRIEADDQQSELSELSDPESQPGTPASTQRTVTAQQSGLSSHARPGMHQGLPVGDWRSWEFESPDRLACCGEALQ